MITTAARGRLVEAFAALTPCPLLCVELGQSLLEQLGYIDDEHPHADWLRI